MPDPVLYLKAMGFSAFASAIALFILVVAVRPATRRWQNVASVLAIGLGLVVGYGMLAIRLTWPPASGLDRLLLVILPATLGVELIVSCWSEPCRIAWPMRCFLAAAIPRILLHGSVHLNGFQGEPLLLLHSAAEVVACSIILAGTWRMLSWLSERSPDYSIPLALALTIQCAGMTIMMAGYIKGGAATFPFTATLLGTTLAACLVIRRPPFTAIIGIGMVELFGVLFIGRFFGRISTEFALTMLLTPLICWVSEFPALRHRNPWLVGSIRLLLIAIPLVAALALAKQDFDRAMTPLLSQRQTIWSTHRSTRDSRSLQFAWPLGWKRVPPLISSIELAPIH